MTTLQPKPDVSVDTVVHFCFEQFLKAVNENNGSHPDPCSAVAGALMNEYGIDREAAHFIYRPPYWVLMDEGILEYHHCNGSCWTMKKNDININSLVKMVLEKYGDTMKERVEEALR